MFDFSGVSGDCISLASPADAPRTQEYLVTSHIGNTLNFWELQPQAANTQNKDSETHCQEKRRVMARCCTSPQNGSAHADGTEQPPNSSAVSHTPTLVPFPQFWSVRADKKLEQGSCSVRRNTTPFPGNSMFYSWILPRPPWPGAGALEPGGSAELRRWPGPSVRLPTLVVPSSASPSALPHRTKNIGRRQ